MRDLPVLTWLEKTGDAAEYDYRDSLGVRHRLVFSNAQVGADKRDLWHLLRDSTREIEGRNALL